MCHMVRTRDTTAQALLNQQAQALQLRPLRLESELFSLLYHPYPESISCTDESLSDVLGVLYGVPVNLSSARHHRVFLQG